MLWWLAISWGCDSPPYELWRVAELGSPGFVSSSGSILVVDLLDRKRGAWTIGARDPEPTFFLENLDNVLAQDFGGTVGTRITCVDFRDGFDLDLLNCETKELILAGDRGVVVPDIDGDGLPDLHGWENGVYFQRPDGWEPGILPLPAVEQVESVEAVAVGDVTGDGLGDVVMCVRDGPSDYIIPNLTTGELHLHVGTEDGYAPEPSWSIELDAPVLTAVSLQMDDDPELELFVLGGDDLSIYPDSIVLWKVDQVRSQAVAERLHEAEDSSNGTRWPDVRSVGDLDGDDKEDVALFSDAKGCETQLLGRVLGSTRGWDPALPIYALPTYREPEDVEAERIIYGGNSGATVGDLNGDGLLDIATVYRQASPRDITFIQIWYPGLDEAPDRTASTTHTGTADPTAHTGATESTRPSKTMEEELPETRVPEEDSSGCGCAAPRARTHPPARWLLGRRPTRGAR